jgi:hypothetical protein
MQKCPKTIRSITGRFSQARYSSPVDSISGGRLGQNGVIACLQPIFRTCGVGVLLWRRLKLGVPFLSASLEREKGKISLDFFSFDSEQGLASPVRTAN